MENEVRELALVWQMDNKEKQMFPVGRETKHKMQIKPSNLLIAYLKI